MGGKPSLSPHHERAYIGIALGGYNLCVGLAFVDPAHACAAVGVNGYIGARLAHEERHGMHYGQKLANIVGTLLQRPHMKYAAPGAQIDTLILHRPRIFEQAASTAIAGITTGSASILTGGAALWAAMALMTPIWSDGLPLNASTAASRVGNDLNRAP